MGGCTNPSVFANFLSSSYASPTAHVSNHILHKTLTLITLLTLTLFSWWNYPDTSIFKSILLLTVAFAASVANDAAIDFSHATPLTVSSCPAKRLESSKPATVLLPTSIIRTSPLLAMSTRSCPWSVSASHFTLVPPQRLLQKTILPASLSQWPIWHQRVPDTEW